MPRAMRRLTGPLTMMVALGLTATALLLPAPAAADAPDAALAKYRQGLDEAVAKALAYLAKNQLEDGSFKSGMKGNTAVASLSVMAFLAAGHTPGVGPYGSVIDRGIDFVLAHQKENGMLTGPTTSHGPMYSHCISTLMLSEVSGMVSPERQKALDTALAKALRVILSAQAVKKPENFRGGWRYQPTSPDSDISCTGWALMALRSARNNGANVPAEAIDQAVVFLMRCRNADGGFAYTPGGGSSTPRAGTGLLCLELCGRHGQPVTVEAGKYILQHLPGQFGGGHFYYGLYYTAQGMFQLGGEAWLQFAEHMYQMLLKFQKDDGSWPQGSSHEGKAGLCYSTAMSVLAATVAYRQLPIYQR